MAAGKVGEALVAYNAALDGAPNRRRSLMALNETCQNNSVLRWGASGTPFRIQ